MDELPAIEDWWAVKLMMEDRNHAQNLIEFAGRVCYDSYPNAYHPVLRPEGRDQRAYIQNLIRQGHLSVLEHASAGFLIVTDRAVTHELVRHRHFGFSQRSTRYVDESGTPYHLPGFLTRDPELGAKICTFLEQAQSLYREAQSVAERFYEDKDLSPTDRRKAARQAARLLLPHGLETQLVMSGNLRAWYEMLEKRCSPHADEGIRDVALQILRLLKEKVAPLVFEHWVIEPPRWEGDPGYAYPAKI